MERVRLDKWLLAARFFKTRSIASHACELGRIQVNGQPAKASREVRVGDMLHIRSEASEFEVEVLVVSAIRGPAAVALTLYRETDASRARRERLVAERKAMRELEGPTFGRPSKRDRRELERFRAQFGQ